MPKPQSTLSAATGVEPGRCVPLTRRPVKTGEIRDGRVELLEGLQENDEVVSAGQVKLRNGQQVEIDNSVQLDQRIQGG